MRASRWSLLFGTALGVVGTLAVQRAMPEAEAGRGKPAQLDRQNFHDSLDLVLDRHVDPVNAPQMMARGLKHMVAGLDPYSHYLTAEERELARKRQREGAESGLVTALHQGDAGSELEVVAVIPGSPAAALGITAGTKLLGIRDRECDQLLSNMEAQLLLAGAPGERIDLAFDRGRGRETLELELAKTKADALVEGELHRQGGKTVGRIAIHAFRSGTGDQVKRELADLRRQAGKEGLDGVILDVRGNPGGEVDEAVVIADLFVNKGVLVRTRGRGGTILREETATEAGTDIATPVIVLQDRRSASASELLAVALQDSGRARVVGERSYGKGTVQEVIGIADGSLLTLTVARYYSPEDRSIDGRGVDPDVLIKDPEGEAGVTAALGEF